ncbi:MAG: hypothetical protein ABSB22_11715 [Thermodesulfobacteriota bacterium]|jgi:DNA-directed RNA polymerase specialized sigma24 family protein
MTNQEEKLKKLIDDTRLGQREAENELFKLLFMICGYYLKKWGAPRSEIQDIIQETLLSLMSVIRSGKQINNWSAYVRGILHYKFVDGIRRPIHNPDLDRLYRVRSRIDRHIEALKGRIETLETGPLDQKDLDQVQSRINMFYEIRSHVLEMIDELIRKTRKASSDDDPQIDTSPTQEQILQNKQQKEILQKAIKETLAQISEDWQKELIKDRLYEGMTYPDLAEKYRHTTPGKARDIYEAFVERCGEKLPDWEDLL